MAFCSHCGAQNRDGASFCESCGQPMGQAAKSAAGAPASPPKSQALKNALSGLGGAPQTMLLIGIGLYVVAAVLTLMQGSMLNVILSAGIAAVGFAMGYLPLTKGDFSTAATGATIAAGAALLFGFLGMANGDVIAAMWNFVAGAMFGLAAMGIKKQH